MTSGWKNESERHKLARMGIQTVRPELVIPEQGNRAFMRVISSNYLPELYKPNLWLVQMFDAKHNDWETLDSHEDKYKAMDKAQNWYEDYRTENDWYRTHLVLSSENELIGRSFTGGYQFLTKKDKQITKIRDCNCPYCKQKIKESVEESDDPAIPGYLK